MNKAIEEQIINTNRNIKNYKAVYFLISIFVILAYIFFGYIGSIIMFIIGFMSGMTYWYLRVERLKKRCDYDCDLLISKGYDKKSALLIISKSFNSTLSDYFHQKVVEKCTTLDEVVLFYTGALPENTKDEDWANECLEKTIINKSPTGVYKVKTKW
jgi:hypothetical protein